MFEVKAASQKSADRKSKTGSMVYESVSQGGKTWFDHVVGRVSDLKKNTSRIRGEASTKLRQKTEKLAEEKLGIPAYKLHLPTKLKQRTKAVAQETGSMAKWWGASELKGLVSYSASNIFGQLDIWGKEFSKALWGGINSLPMSSGKSHTGEKMLDALLASQASRANSFKF